MSQSNRPTIHIHFLAVQSQLLLYSQILRRKRLIHLNQINVVQRKPSLLQSHFSSRHRTAPHHLRLNPCNPPANNPPQRLNTSLARFLERHQHHSRRPIDNPARVPSSNSSALTKRSLQLRQSFQSSLRPPM